jgi:hypothetical protein
MCGSLCAAQIPKDDWFCPECRPPVPPPLLPSHAQPAPTVPAASPPVEAVSPDPNLAELACAVCLSTAQENKMLLCDGCPAAYHLFCLQPKLSKIPKDDWFCPACRPSAALPMSDGFASAQLARATSVPSSLPPRLPVEPMVRLYDVCDVLSCILPSLCATVASDRSLT